MKTALIIVSAAGLAAAQFSYNETTGKYTCDQPNQAYCVAGSMKSNIILRCDSNAIGKPGNCNDNLDGEPPSGNTYSPCWQTSNTTGDGACSKNCVVYGGSGNYNGTFTLPADECTPTYTATSSSATTTATTLTQSVTISTSLTSASSASEATTTGPASGTETTVIGTTTTTVCTESESSTTSSGAVTGSPPPTTTTPAPPATTIIPPPASPPSSDYPGGPSSPPPGGSTAPEPSTSGAGPVVTSTSTTSVAAVSTTAFPTAGAAVNHVGVGLGLMGLLVGAML